MKCRVCREAAVIQLRRHNANFCQEHFLRLCRDQVAKAVSDHKMLAAGDRVLVAVSGGKDSLALWDILSDLGYEADGVYVGLGIGDYSDASLTYTQQFAAQRDFSLQVVNLDEEHGYNIPSAAKATKRSPCSTCGLSKRHVFDEAALNGGYDELAATNS